MRMRFKPYARPELAAWPNYIDEPVKNKGCWNDCFDNSSLPLNLELGCGKGGFISEIACKNPEFNYLGVDIKSEVLVVAKRSIEKVFAANNCTPKNVAICSQNIEKISDILSEKDMIQRIYINFCNPWYKLHDAKHRLTHPRQLIQYRDFLVENGEIWFKTDDDALFEDSLRYFGLCGFEVFFVSCDLHKNEPDWNIRTEHEEMFASEGIKIKACIVKKVEAQLNREEISKWRTI